jgi:hypothetical protein
MLSIPVVAVILVLDGRLGVCINDFLPEETFVDECPGPFLSRSFTPRKLAISSARMMVRFAVKIRRRPPGVTTF